MFFFFFFFFILCFKHYPLNLSHDPCPQLEVHQATQSSIKMKLRQWHDKWKEEIDPSEFIDGKLLIWKLAFCVVRALILFTLYEWMNESLDITWRWLNWVKLPSSGQSENQGEVRSQQWVLWECETSSLRRASGSLRWRAAESRWESEKMTPKKALISRVAFTSCVEVAAGKWESEWK